MPILKAKGEAEGLCAQLNGEGQVDACITTDSDAFLFGAHCDIIFIWLLLLFLLHIVNMMVMVVVMMNGSAELGHGHLELVGMQSLDDY
ncbi:hypothetical protein RHGRI_011523 [Rhododendron griersonianum]|uniref:XPG-I domain-containing protein n=1 Tax=Rhododendron griersonianum TaxID=479676 RepID=A0AAV6KML8_9ERIC|nr:hypothetical protein RHGRI_011523 [Rhododendron griersonianum]